MTITPTALMRGTAVSAAAAGLIFIGVQINHPHLDVTSITSTEVVVRGSFKVLMATLALIGITGMYLRQVKESGVLGLLGYVTFGIGYLVIMATSFVAAFVLPSVAGTDPSYVSDVIAVSSGGTATGDVGLVGNAFQLQGIGFLAGGLVFGIALFRARVLARWAAVLLAVGSVATLTLSMLPDAFYRFLAFPNGIAMIGLGVSLWLATRSTRLSVPEPAGVA